PHAAVTCDRESGPAALFLLRVPTPRGAAVLLPTQRERMGAWFAPSPIRSTSLNRSSELFLKAAPLPRDPAPLTTGVNSSGRRIRARGLHDCPAPASAGPGGEPRLRRGLAGISRDRRRRAAPSLLGTCALLRCPRLCQPGASGRRRARLPPARRADS